MEIAQQNIDWFNNRFISKDGQRLFCNSGICSELLNSLSEQDGKDINRLMVYFNPVFSPASQVTTFRSIEAGANIVSFDLNLLKSLSTSEFVAIILHELGHIFHPEYDITQREYNADDFARARGYGATIASSLKMLSTTYPDLYHPELTQKRIERIKKDQ